MVWIPNAKFGMGKLFGGGQTIVIVYLKIPKKGKLFGIGKLIGMGCLFGNFRYMVLY